MSCKILKPKDPQPFTSDDLKIGEMGMIIDDSIHNGQVLLRTYEGLVSLSNPRQTWPERHGSSPNFMIGRVYRVEVTSEFVS